MSHQYKGMDDALLMQKLKDILLREDREELRELKEIINEPSRLSEKVSPILEERLEFFKQNFPAEFKIVVDRLIEQKLEESQERILNVIYPVMGKMITKYITHQFQMLKDSIDRRIKNTFSRQGFWGRFKSKIFGVQDSEVILSDVDKPVIEEIYIIQKNSGLLMGRASTQETVDQDVIAGMLTAIKSFVEDAFFKKTEDLEMIEYDNYKIFLHNFHSYYFAVIMSGSLSSAERSGLSSHLTDFASTELSDHLQPDEANFHYLSQKLEKRFFVQPELLYREN